MRRAFALTALSVVMSVVPAGCAPTSGTVNHKRNGNEVEVCDEHMCGWVEVGPDTYASLEQGDHYSKSWDDGQ